MVRKGTFEVHGKKFPCLYADCEKCQTTLRLPANGYPRNEVRCIKCGPKWLEKLK